MKHKGTLIVVKDCNKAYQFYHDLFGLEMTKDNDGNMELSGSLFLQEAGYWESFIGKDVVPYSNHSELYFEEPDLLAFVKKLEALYPETEYVNRLMTHSWGQNVVRFYDPDGNMIEVGTPVSTLCECNGKVIETERLFLREMNEGDYDALYLVLADSDIMQHYPYTFDEKRVKGWIEKNMERYRVFGFGLWAVCLRDTGEMIGDCGLTMQNINGAICPEIGYHIRRDCQRKGYAKEAASAVRDWAFENTPLKVLYSYMKKDNISSAATAESIGMHKSDEYADSEQELTLVFTLERNVL